jgi:hypothetical protein
MLLISHGLYVKYIQNFWSGNLKGIDHSEDLDVDGRIILEWILVKYMENYGLDLSDSGKGPVACCEHGNELSVSIKSGEFLD